MCNSSSPKEEKGVFLSFRGYFRFQLALRIIVTFQQPPTFILLKGQGVMGPDLPAHLR